MSLSALSLVPDPADMTDSYARGHYTVGKEMVESVLDKIRRVTGTSCRTDKQPLF